MKTCWILILLQTVLLTVQSNRLDVNRSNEPLTVLPIRTCSWCPLLSNPEKEPARTCEKTCQGHVCYIVVNQYFNLTLTAGCLNTTDAAFVGRVEIENICHRSERSTVCACATNDQCNSPQAPMASFTFVDEKILDRLRAEAEPTYTPPGKGTLDNILTKTNEIPPVKEPDGMKGMVVTIGNQNHTDDIKSSREVLFPDPEAPSTGYSSLFGTAGVDQPNGHTTEKVVKVSSEYLTIANSTIHPLASRVEMEITEELARSLNSESTAEPLKDKAETPIFGFNFTVPLEFGRPKTIENASPVPTVVNSIVPNDPVRAVSFEKMPKSTPATVTLAKVIPFQHFDVKSENANDIVTVKTDIITLSTKRPPAGMMIIPPVGEVIQTRIHQENQPLPVADSFHSGHANHNNHTVIVTAGDNANAAVTNANPRRILLTRTNDSESFMRNSVLLSITVMLAMLFL